MIKKPRALTIPVVEIYRLLESVLHIEIPGLNPNCPPRQGRLIRIEPMTGEMMKDGTRAIVTAPSEEILEMGRALCMRLKINCGPERPKLRSKKATEHAQIGAMGPWELLVSPDLFEAILMANSI